MVKLILLFKANLNRIVSIEPEVDIEWNLKLKCSNCGEEHDKVVPVNEQQTESVSGSRGTANLVIKCKFCKRENSINIVDKSRKIYTNNGKFAPIVTFDCRGIDILSINLGNGFKAKGEKGVEFGVDFSDGDWTEWDDSIKDAVGIENPETKLETI